MSIPDRFASLRTWARAGRRAPHKPLLALYALARLQRGEPRLVEWTQLEPKLVELLTTFGPPGRAPSPQYPFWRMRGDGGLWEVTAAEKLTPNSSGDVSLKQLPALNVSGGLAPEVDEALRKDPAMVNRIAADLLDAHFAASLHGDILDAIGMPYVADGSRRKRDPAFRREVLRIYEHRCAICGYDGRLEQRTFGLDAAHVQWHAAYGPDTLANALALCAIHHRAFDKGALGLSADHKVLVSSHVHGSSDMTRDMLVRYAGAPLASPQRGEPVVASEFIAWHADQVFRGPARR